MAVSLVAAAVYPVAFSGDPADPPTVTRPGSTPPSARPDGATATPLTVALGPVVRPIAFRSTNPAPAAADNLRALADRITDAPYDNTSGKYTHIRTVGWNAVFDEEPGGNTQRIEPSEKNAWYAADGSGRAFRITLPTVYPNEASERYWKQRPATGSTPGTVSEEPTGGRPGRTETLPADPASLTQLIDRGGLSAVVGVYQMFAVPTATRAAILRILAGTPGLVWRGEVTDRAGRRGVAVSVEADSAQQVLIFDPRTGVLLAWEEVTEPETVAGSTLILVHEHTDRIG